MVRKARYPRWAFSVDQALDLVAFHPGPDRQIAKAGPWRIPEGAEEAEVAELLYSAVAGVVGPAAARERFRFDGKPWPPK